MKNLKYLIVVILFLFSAQFCSGEIVNFSLGSVAVIRNQQNLTRVLVKVPFSISDAKKIQFAEVRFDGFLPNNYQGIVSLEAYAISRDWEPGNVTWNYPWQKKGGDFDTTKSCVFALGKIKNVSVRLDVTKYVRAWITGASNYGLLLKRPKIEGGGFGTEGAGLVNVLGKGKLIVHYLK